MNEARAQYLIHVKHYKPHQDRFYALRDPLTASALALYGNYCLKMPKVFGDQLFFCLMFTPLNHCTLIISWA